MPSLMLPRCLLSNTAVYREARNTYPVARIVRSLQQNLSTSTLPPFNHKQNCSNYITVTITHPVTWEQLSNIATAAAAAAGPSTAVAIVAIAAAAALVSPSTSFDTSVRKAFLSKRFHEITFAPAQIATLGMVLSSTTSNVNRFHPPRPHDEPSSLFSANTEKMPISSAVK